MLLGRKRLLYGSHILDGGEDFPELLHRGIVHRLVPDKPAGVGDGERRFRSGGDLLCQEVGNLVNGTVHAARQRFQIAGPVAQNLRLSAVVCITHVTGLDLTHGELLAADGNQGIVRNVRLVGTLAVVSPGRVVILRGIGLLTVIIGRIRLAVGFDPCILRGRVNLGVFFVARFPEVQIVRVVESAGGLRTITPAGGRQVGGFAGHVFLLEVFARALCRR